MPLAVRLALILGATLLVSVLRRRFPGGRMRNVVMFCGTIGGVALGAAIASPLMRVFNPPHVDVVDVCMFVGIPIGWLIAWPLARRFPADRGPRHLQKRH
jgi:hypothetical protein